MYTSHHQRRFCLLAELRTQLLSEPDKLTNARPRCARRRRCPASTDGTGQTLVHELGLIGTATPIQSFLHKELHTATAMDDLMPDITAGGLGDGLSGLGEYALAPPTAANATKSFVGGLDDLVKTEVQNESVHLRHELERMNQWFAQQLDAQNDKLDEQNAIIQGQAAKLRKHEELMQKLLEFKIEATSRLEHVETKDLGDEIADATRQLEENLHGFREAEDMRRETELNQTVARVMARFSRLQFKQYFLHWGQSAAHATRLRGIQEKMVHRLEHHSVARGFLPWLEKARIRRDRDLTEEIEKLNGLLEAQQAHGAQVSTDVISQVEAMKTEQLTNKQYFDEKEVEMQNRLVEEGATISRSLVEKLESLKAEQQQQLDRVAEEKQALQQQQEAEREETQESRLRTLQHRCIARMEGGQLSRTFVPWLQAARSAHVAKIAAQLQQAQEDLAAMREDISGTERRLAEAQTEAEQETAQNAVEQETAQKAAHQALLDRVNQAEQSLEQTRGHVAGNLEEGLNAVRGSLEAGLSDARGNFAAGLSDVQGNLEAGLSEARGNVTASLNDVRAQLQLGVQKRNEHLYRMFVNKLQRMHGDATRGLMASVLDTWSAEVARRVTVKRIAFACINKLESGSVVRAFVPWLRKAREISLLRKSQGSAQSVEQMCKAIGDRQHVDAVVLGGLAEELDLLRGDHDEEVGQRHHQVALINSALQAFAEQVDNTEKQAHQKKIAKLCRRAALRMRMTEVAGSFAGWQNFVQRRRALRARAVQAIWTLEKPCIARVFAPWLTAARRHKEMVFKAVEYRALDLEVRCCLCVCAAYVLCAHARSC